MSSEYGSATYGDAWANIYDDPVLGWPAPDHVVVFLAGRSSDGPALDLGPGTGRIAIPLAARGVQVVGVEASDEMIRVLKSKPGGDAIDLRQEDFSDFDHGCTYPLIYCVGQSFLQLPDQESQQRCLRRVAAHLAEDGRFVMDALVPDLRRFRMGQDLLVNKCRRSRNSSGLRSWNSPGGGPRV
jgi:SAM-dependent methyltransferase